MLRSRVVQFVGSRAEDARLSLIKRIRQLGLSRELNLTSVKTLVEVFLELWASQRQGL